MKFNSHLKAFVIFSAIISVMIISGCVGQTDLTTSTNGIVIRDVYTDPPSDLLETGDVLTVYYQIENVGGTVATNVYTTIFGFPWITDEQRIANYCHPSCTSGKTLYPPDIVTGSLGGLEPVSFKILVPEDILPPGVRKTFTPTIRVVYTYRTETASIIPVYGKQRYNRDIQTGGIQQVLESSIPIQTTISGTPLSVSLTGPDKIVVPQSDKTESRKYTYQVTFSDIGQGHPITGNVPGLIVIKSMRIEGHGAYFENCLDVDSQGKEIVNKEIKLIGSSVTKSCTIGVENNKGDESSWNDREFDTINIFFEIDYEYFIESDFSVTISRPGSQQN